MKKKSVWELDRLDCQDYQNTRKLPFVIVVDNVRSLNNIGAIFRTSDAFLVDKIYLCGISATPPSPEIHKTALGAEDSVCWEYFGSTVDCIRMLKDSGHVICAIEQVHGSVNPRDFMVEEGKRYALVLGNEVDGVLQSVVDMADVSLELPQHGTKHSLNVSVSAGLLIWEFYNKLMPFRG